MKWMILFGVLFVVCLAISTWASPSQCFQMYRRRAFLSDWADVRVVFDLGKVILPSTGTALVLIGLCGLGVRLMELARTRPARRLHVSVQEANLESGNLVANQQIANERIASSSLERAA